MKLTRRNFLKVTSAATAWLLSPFKRLIGDSKIIPDGVQKPVTSHRSCCYLYNAGSDIELPREMTFNQFGLIPGGQIIKIEQGEERLITKPVFESRSSHSDYRLSYEQEWLEKGLYRVEKVATAIYQPNTTGLYKGQEWYLDDNGDWKTREVEISVPKRDGSQIEEDTHVIVHPAKEIADNLITEGSRSHMTLVRIEEWDNRPVDLKSVNDLIQGKSLDDRQIALSKIPRSWQMTRVLLNHLPKAIKDHRGVAYADLSRIKKEIQEGAYLHRRVDQYVLNLLALTGEPIEFLIRK